LAARRTSARVVSGASRARRLRQEGVSASVVFWCGSAPAGPIFFKPCKFCTKCGRHPPVATNYRAQSVHLCTIWIFAPSTIFSNRPSSSRLDVAAGCLRRAIAHRLMLGILRDAGILSKALVRAIACPPSSSARSSRGFRAPTGNGRSRSSASAKRSLEPDYIRMGLYRQNRQRRRHTRRRRRRPFRFEHARSHEWRRRRSHPQ
jgi:hypothetical protein